MERNPGCEQRGIFMVIVRTRDAGGANGLIVGPVPVQGQEPGDQDAGQV
jgi:hypothetical protein